jgi:hypothetical protein
MIRVFVGVPEVSTGSGLRVVLPGEFLELMRGQQEE